MDGLCYLSEGMFRDDDFWDSWRGSAGQSRKKEAIHVQEWRSIRPNEDHEHGNGGNLAKERDYVVLNHIEQVPYQRGTSKHAGRYVPVLPQQNVRDYKVQTKEVMITSSQERNCGNPNGADQLPRKKRRAAYLSLHQGACESCDCEMVPQLEHHHDHLGNDDPWFYASEMANNTMCFGLSDQSVTETPSL